MTVPDLSFRSALLLADAESNATVDRRALREAGMERVRVMTSGLQAAHFLAGSAEDASALPDVVLCHNKLADMEGARLAEIIRLHPRLLFLPLLMVVGNNDEAARMDALVSGSSGILARPYSQVSLRRALAELEVSRTGHLLEARNSLNADAFDAALAHYAMALREAATPEKAFREGMLHLRRRDWDAAIQAFHKAMRQMVLKGESELGLAAAWRGKGDLGKSRRYLLEASHTFARAAQWHKARATYARLLREAPDAPSPFLAAAENLIRAEKFDEAAEALAAGYELGAAKDMPDRLAQACLFTRQPEYSLDRVRQSLKNVSPAPEAASLDQEICAAFQSRNLAAQARGSAPRRRRGISLRRGEMEEDMGDGLANLPEAAFKDSGAESGRAAPRAGKRAERETGPAQDPLPAPLRPLNEEDMEARLFSRLPGLNEALTVARFTWKLLRNDK